MTFGDYDYFGYEKYQKRFELELIHKEIEKLKKLIKYSELSEGLTQQILIQAFNELKS